MTSPSGRHTRYNHSEIRDVARKLHRELAGMSGAGTLPDLTSRGQVSAAAFGNWDAARALSATVGHGNRQIAQVYQRFLDDFRAAVAALEKAADNYQKSDETILANINAAGRMMGDRSSSGPAPTRSTVKPME